LANGLGNLASRILAMVNQYCGGVIPNPSIFHNAPQSPDDKTLTLFQPEILLAEKAERTKAEALAALNSFEFSRALENIWALVSAVDEYLVVRRPWALGLGTASDAARKVLEGVLYASTATLRYICVLGYAVVPDACTKIWACLGQDKDIGQLTFDELQWTGLKPGTKVRKPDSVFPRVDKKEAMERIEAMEQEIRNPGSAQPSAPATPASSGSTAPVAAQSTSAAAAPAEDPGVVKIGIEDFAKVEMRVGLVKSAEKVAGADKLLKLMVDVGDEVRQIVAGIATAYQPEELVGRKVVVVANLAPRKLRGVESNGMLLAASTAEGKPVLCTFAEEVPVGARLK
jgi:methionyl-tRNA synthetase